METPVTINYGAIHIIIKLLCLVIHFTVYGLKTQFYILQFTDDFGSVDIRRIY